jgi:hypothetical protein
VIEYPDTDPRWYFRITGNTYATWDLMEHHTVHNEAFVNPDVSFVFGNTGPVVFDVAIHAPTWEKAVHETCRRITTVPGVHPVRLTLDAPMSLDCAARLLADAVPTYAVHDLVHTLVGTTTHSGPTRQAVPVRYHLTDITKTLTRRRHHIPAPLAAVTTARYILATYRPTPTTSQHR